MSEEGFDVVSHLKVEDYLNQVDYNVPQDYVPSDFALQFVTFIKLVNGAEGEENKTPLVHYWMLDTLASGERRIINLMFRGAAKTTIFGEYMILYIATYGEIPGFGEVTLGLYVSDSIENGVKNMRKNLEYRWENSDFLRHYVPEVRFTDIRWEFKNSDGKALVMKGYGASALPLDTVLFTEDGKNTTIGEVQIGDWIYGADGKLTQVTQKSEIFNRPVYRIKLDDGRSLDVCEEHINNVWVNTNPNNTVRLEEKNLTTLELLQQPLTHTKLGNKQHRGTSTKRLVYIKNVAAMEYPEKAFPLDPYTLGLLLGDGSMRENNWVGLHSHREDWEFYKTQIPYPIGSEYLDKRNGNVISATIRGVQGAVRALGLNGTAISNKRVPEEYFSGSINQRQAILAGLLDTDGTVTKNGRVHFTSVSQGLVEDVARLVRSLGGTATTYLTHNPEIHANNGFDRSPAYKAEIWLEGDAYVRLPRKKVRLQQNGSRNRWLKKARFVPVIAVEPIQQVPTQCIGVDNADRLFVAGNYVITHNTGVRGAKEMGTRPQLAILDDLVSDEDARSATVIAAIEATVYKAVNYALHPKKNLILWSGTPFNAKDPLYKAVESGAWAVNAFPICEKFPCSKEEFRGAWPDRFPYEYVKGEYERAVRLGKVDTFNQELMLRIMSDEDRSVLDSDIRWYKLDNVIKNKSRFNFYITTDFATSVKDSADFSVISVWAYNNQGDWLWCDGVVKRQQMDKNVDDLFRLAQLYKPQQVGIEITGQQKGFIPWIQNEMMVRNIYFPLASDHGSTELGIRPNTNKLQRFNTGAVPLFKAGKIYFPAELKGDPRLAEALDEITLASIGGFRSKHDDFLDTISMLQSLQPWKPSEEAPLKPVENGIWEADEVDEDDDVMASYVV